MGGTDNAETIRQVVAEVWAEVLPDEPMQEDLIWSEAGVDSLKSLHILLRIEQYLGRELSFDLFARELTLGDLIRSLAEGEEAGQTGARPGRRTLFLAPGIFGDEPRLADLRRALRDQVSCHTLQLPELDQPSKVLADLTATARPLVLEIVKAQPEGPIAVAGYSFGSLVAYQIALELRAAGRMVDLLCLIDTAPPPTEAEIVAEPASLADNRRSISSKLSAILENLSFQPKDDLFLYFERIIYKTLMFSGRFGLARWLVVRNMKRYDFERGRLRRRRLLDIFRRRAMQTWRPSPYDGRVLLIESDVLHENDHGRRWARWCPNLEIAVVGGDHWTIFEPEPLARLVPALVRALGLPAPTPASPRPALAEALAG